MTIAHRRNRWLLFTIAFLLATISLPARWSAPGAQQGGAPLASYIVQAQTWEQAAAAVERAGGQVTRDLAIVRGVAALLSAGAHQRLAREGGVSITPNARVLATGDAPEPAVSARPTADSYPLYPSLATGAYLLHQRQVQTRQNSCANRTVTTQAATSLRPLQGSGVTVAVIDSGFMEMQNSVQWDDQDAEGALYAYGDGGRCIIYRDFLPRHEFYGNLDTHNSTDQNGHGTHVISTIADSRLTSLLPGLAPSAVGVAPKVNLLVARALDRDGAGNYGDVIAAIQWIVQHKNDYNVRVLNLSLYSPVTGPYWADPLNQAVMEAWKAGIVVVVAAGNDGPEAGTVTVPGNNPYVISVGAIKSGIYTVSGSDELATYSSRGPTESAFVKPDVLTPASRTIAPVPDGSTLALAIPDARVQVRADVDFGIGMPSKRHTYYQLSGTSMAAAQVSGIAALMLQASPTLTNDQVKYRMLATARPAIDAATDEPFYSVWEQGAGQVDAEAAVEATTLEAANAGLDVALDLATDTHYWGRTEYLPESGDFVLVDPISQQVVDVWAGAGRTWAGAGRTWAGAGRTWAGAGRSWAGAGRTWAGNSTAEWTNSASLWAGAGRTWAGSTPVTSLDTASTSEVLVYDSIYTTYLPAVRR